MWGCEGTGSVLYGIHSLQNTFLFLVLQNKWFYPLLFLASMAVIFSFDCFAIWTLVCVWQIAQVLSWYFVWVLAKQTNFPWIYILQLLQSRKLSVLPKSRHYEWHMHSNKEVWVNWGCLLFFTFFVPFIHSEDKNNSYRMIMVTNSVIQVVLTGLIWATVTTS